MRTFIAILLAVAVAVLGRVLRRGPDPFESFPAFRDYLGPDY